MSIPAWKMFCLMKHVNEACQAMQLVGVMLHTKRLESPRSEIDILSIWNLDLLACAYI